MSERTRRRAQNRKRMGIVRTINTYRHFYNESLPPKPKWGTKDIPDLTGKVMLVTGGNAGIGYEIVKGVLEKNAKVYVGCRSEEKGKDASDRLEKATGKRPEVLVMDLADLRSVKKAAEEFSRCVYCFSDGGMEA